MVGTDAIQCWQEDGEKNILRNNCKYELVKLLRKAIGQKLAKSDMYKYICKHQFPLQEYILEKYTSIDEETQIYLDVPVALFITIKIRTNFTPSIGNTYQ